jgi:hypothetical protein
MTTHRILQITLTATRSLACEGDRDALLSALALDGTVPGALGWLTLQRRTHTSPTHRASATRAGLALANAVQTT